MRTDVGPVANRNDHLCTCYTSDHCAGTALQVHQAAASDAILTWRPTEEGEREPKEKGGKCWSLHCAAKKSTRCRHFSFLFPRKHDTSLDVRVQSRTCVVAKEEGEDSGSDKKR